MRRARLPVVALIAAVVLAAGAYAAARAVLASDLVRSALEQQLAARVGQPVRIRSATAALFPRVALDLHDVAIGEPAAVQLGTVRIVTGMRGLFSRTIADAEVVVSDSRLSLPLPAALTQVASAAEDDPPSAATAFTVTSVRRFALRDVALAGGDHTLLVDLEAAIEGDRLDIAWLTARAPATRIEARGVLTSMARLEGSLEATADRLDVTEMIAIGSALTAPASTPAQAGGESAPAPMQLTVTLAAPTGRFGVHDFTDLTTTVEVVPGRLRLAPLALRLFGGSVEGRLEAETGGRVPQLRLTGRVEGLDVGELTSGSGSAGGITGQLGGNVSIAAAAADAEQLQRGARGTIQAAITDGTMPGLDMVRTVVLAFGRPSGAPPEGSGSVFSRLGGTFNLAGGTLTSDNLAMASRDFDLAGRGTLNLITGDIDARVDVVLSRELTGQAGADLRRYAQEDGRVVIPATVGGTLQRARVSLDLADAAKRAIGSELRRRTKSLLDDLFRGKGDP